MSIGPRDAAVFLIDCSQSMGTPRQFAEGEGQERRTESVTSLDIMKRYVKAKIAQRIMRDLKTTPLAIVAFPHKKTKNHLTSEQLQRDREGEASYLKDEDPYRHFYELVSFDDTPNSNMIKAVEEVQAGQTTDVQGDILSAIILGLSIIIANPKVRGYKKEVFLLTDGETETDWDALEVTMEKFKAENVSLTVVGMDFDDEAVGYVEESKSAIKRDNERRLSSLVSSLDNSILATASHAMSAIRTPYVKEVKSMSISTTLSFGNKEMYPESSISMFVEVKKAITAAAVKTMKQMSMTGFKKTATAQSGTQMQATQGNGQGGSHNSVIGKLFERMLEEQGMTIGDEEDADLASHAVVRETLTFYRPSDLPSSSLDKPTQGQGEDDGPDPDDETRWRPTMGKELDSAYYYGGDLVPIQNLKEGFGTLKGNKTAMEIIGFVKQSTVRFEWRMGDLLYVYGARGQLGSQSMLSALINAMMEKKSAALVRWVGKGMNKKEVFTLPDPKIGLLWPTVGENDEGLPVEYCVWSQLPFAEDVRNLNFNSLENIYNRKNVKLSEHKNLPTKEMDKAMDEFVDKMDLVYKDEEEMERAGVANEGDEENLEPKSWFSVEDSFSPAIHNIQNTLVFRLSEPGAELPPVPSNLTKYLEPPAFVVERAKEAKGKAIEAFNITRVPPKPKKVSKKVQNFRTEADEAVDVDALFSSIAPRVKEAPPTLPYSITEPTSSLSKPSTFEKREAMDVDDQKIKPESSSLPTSMDVDDDDEIPTDDDVPATDDEGESASPVPAKVGEKDPVSDFGRILGAKGPGPATTQMFETVEKLVRESFSSANYSLALECLTAAREASMTYPPAYNEGLTKLVSSLQSDPKKQDFVGWIKKSGLGLVEGQNGATKDEAVAFSDRM